MNEFPQDPQRPDHGHGSDPARNPDLNSSDERPSPETREGSESQAGSELTAPINTVGDEPTQQFRTAPPAEDPTRLLEAQPGPSNAYPGQYQYPPHSGQPQGAQQWGHPSAPAAQPMTGVPTGQHAPWDHRTAAPAPGKNSRKGLAAAAVVGVLLLGAGAGAGGAALVNALGDNGSSNNGTTYSTVVDNGKQTASSGTVESVAAKVLPSVVKIEVQGSGSAGSGSGIILSSDGEILTNNHVVELAADGGTITVAFNDGSRARATIVGSDALTDTALIKAEGVSDLTPATLGKSANLNVGQSVVAIGSPYGLNATVTSGIVSALNRPVSVGSDSQGNSTTYPAVQTDAAINPGNSGGPLVDMAGNVVGINSSIRTASSSSSSESGSIGLGFAIPMDEVVPIVEQMRAGETPTHARLGIGVQDSTDGDALGAAVSQINDGSAAAKAGLKQGDVVVRVDDTIIEGADSLVATIRSHRPGDEVKVTWERNGKQMSATMKLDSDEGTTTQQDQPGNGQGQGNGNGQGNPFDGFPFGNN